MPHKQWIAFPVLSEAFPLSTDSVMLADFTVLHQGDRVCDLGAGVGTLSLLLASAWTECSFTGFELQEDLVSASAELIASNRLSNRVHVFQGDLRMPLNLAPSGVFDAAVSNPPYFSSGSGALPGDPHQRIARSEDYCSMEALCVCAAHLLKYGGSFSLVHKPERLADLCFSMRNNGIEPKRLRFVKKAPGTSPSLLLLQGKKAGKPGLSILPDLELTDAAGNPSEEFKRIYQLI